jgi:hypothetical protein
MKRKGEPTATNIFVLWSIFKDADQVPNKVGASQIQHMKRCYNAGLCEIVLDGNFLALRLTDKGRAAIAADHVVQTIKNRQPTS